MRGRVCRCSIELGQVCVAYVAPTGLDRVALVIAFAGIDMGSTFGM